MIPAGPSVDDAMARLAEIRAAIERHATETWLLEREADELRYQVRLFNAKAAGDCGAAS